MSSASSNASSLCLLVEPDFGFGQGFSKRLRGMGVEVIEYSSSERLAETVDDYNPNIVFLSLSSSDPFDCIRALTSLSRANFTGRVQLIARCEPHFLRSICKIGEHLSLTMLNPMQKPVEYAAVHKIVTEHKLAGVPATPREFSLGEALAQGRITFWYQPKIDIRRKQVTGAEASVRLNHPQHGVVSPGRFLSGAEDDALQDLATLALVNALKVSMMFERQGIQLAVGINVGIESLLRLPAADLVRKHRPQGGSWPGLVIDVTERQAINKINPLRLKSEELKACGISLAIDNCGRGNSSFAMLSQVEFAEVKIDPSLVRGCDSQAGNSNVCKTIIQMAHNFSIKATAVGIETPAEAQHLISQGCDFAQGYFFGKPMTEQQLVTMIMAGRSNSTDFCAPVARAM